MLLLSLGASVFPLESVPPLVLLSLVLLPGQFLLQLSIDSDVDIVIGDLSLPELLSGQSVSLLLAYLPLESLLLLLSLCSHAFQLLSGTPLHLTDLLLPPPPLLLTLLLPPFLRLPLFLQHRLLQ